MDAILLKHPEFEPKENKVLEQSTVTQGLESSNSNETLMIHDGKLWLWVSDVEIQL